MGILQGIFKSRDKPQNATSGSAYRFFMGGSAAGKNVNERSAMQMTAVYACVRILSEAIAGLPLHMYQYLKDGTKPCFRISREHYLINKNSRKQQIIITCCDKDLDYLINKKVNLLKYLDYKILQVTGNAPDATYEMFYGDDC